MIIYADSLHASIYKILRGECIVVDVLGAKSVLKTGDQIQRRTLFDLRQWSTVIALTHVDVLVIDPKDIEKIMLTNDELINYWTEVRERDLE